MFRLLTFMMLTAFSTALAQTEEPAAPVADPPAEEPAPPPPVEAPPADIDAGTRPARKKRSSDAGTEHAQKRRPEDAGTPVEVAPKKPERDAGTSVTADSKLDPETTAVRDEAKHFFRLLLAADARAIVQRASFPFHLENRTFNNAEDLLQELQKHLRNKRTDRIMLYGIDVLSPADMEKKYGKPPARLNAMPWKNAKTYIAVANFSGRPSVAIFKADGQGEYKAVGYHD